MRLMYDLLLGQLCSYCKLESLERLPAGLTYLNLEYNDPLVALPEALPPNLEMLRIQVRWW